MQSALEVILRSIALRLGVSEREIGGLTYFYPDRSGIGFVLFDESSGGGGAVLPLVLSGNQQIDARRHDQIKEIVAKAIKMCESCTECNQQQEFKQIDLNLPPLSASEMFNQKQQDQEQQYRVRQSCYKCLRSYRNQRVHHLLARGDAVKVLRTLL